MKIALVIPPFSDFYDTPGRRANLGAAVVREILTKNGDAVIFHDLPSQQKPAPVLLPDRLQYLKEWILSEESGPTAFFTTFRRFGPDADAAAEKILGNNPDLVLISLFAWCYGADTAALCKKLKRRSPKTAVYIGGAGATVHPMWFLKNSGADGILSGEAETVIPGFLKHISGKNAEPRPGILLPDAPEPDAIRTTGQSILPAAAICMERREGSLVSLSLSRGCPAGCAFCSIRLCHGEKFRTTSLTKLRTKIRSLKINDIPTFNFEDDNLLLDREYFRKAVGICRELYPEARLNAENGLDYRLLDSGMIRFLTESGLRRLNLSLGTISGNAGRGQNRQTDLEKYETALKELQRTGVPVTTYFICGLPGDSRQDTINTLLYLADKPTVIGISPFYALPGLPGFPPDHPGFAAGPDRSRGMALSPWTGTHTTAELMTAFRLTRFINLLKSDPKDPLHRKLICESFRTSRIHTIIKNGREKQIQPVPNLSAAMEETVLRGLRNTIL